MSQGDLPYWSCKAQLIGTYVAHEKTLSKEDLASSLAIKIKFMKDNIKLGFGPLPVPQYLFVGGKDDASDEGEYLWYSLDFSNNSKKIPIHTPALTGLLTGIKMVNKPHKGDDVIKVDVSISADRKYVIRTGIDTIFGRGLLLALELFENIKDIPVTICVTPGDEKNVIYASVYNAETEEVVKFDWDKSKKLSPIVNTLRVRLGHEAQDIKQVLEDGRKK